MAERLQAGLGDVSYPGRGDLDNSGKLTIARVVEVNNENHTADVVAMSQGYTGQWEGEEEEAITCLRMQRHIGYDDETEKAYGEITPLFVGEYVVIGYLNSDKHRPVILGALHPPHKDNNDLGNMPKTRAYGETEYEEEETYKVSKLQEYELVDANGQYEKAKHTGRFEVGRQMPISDHRESAFSYKDLSIKDKEKWQTIRADEKDIFYQPFKYLSQTMDRYDLDDPNITYHRFFHDSENHVTRISKDNKDSIFYTELDDKGYRIVINRETSQRERHYTEPENYNHRTLRISDEKFIERKDRVPNTAPDKIEGKIVKIDIGQESGRVKIRTQNNENEYSEITLKPEGELREEVKNSSGTSFISLKGGDTEINAENHLKLVSKRIDLN